jgi:hypothetical protein
MVAKRRRPAQRRQSLKHGGDVSHLIAFDDTDATIIKATDFHGIPCDVPCGALTLVRLA